MLTKTTTSVQTIDRNHVNIGGHEVACTWDANGAHISIDSLQSIKDAGHANWICDEMCDIAWHAESLMDQAYTKAYDIVIYEGCNNDQIHVLDSIRVDNDAAANAYADDHYADHEWYILDAEGNNING